jgi:pimeloyl-ACP methyl ester carboxylesterase
MRFGAWFVLASLALAAGTSERPARAADRVEAKKVEDLAKRWFQARPKTKFQEWDPAVRAALVKEAEAYGPLPEGSLASVRDLLWKAVRKHGPSGKEEIDTPYGKATWIQKGTGGAKSGLILGLHGGGEGAGSSSEPAGTWVASGHMGMYPQGIRLVHDTWNTVHGERFTLTLIEIAKAQFEVDPDRVYSMGFSMGGTGSWFLAGRHPDLLAGAIPAHGVHMASTTGNKGVKVKTAAEVTAMEHGVFPNVRNLAVYWYTGHEDVNCEPGTYLKGWEILQGLQKEDPDGYRLLNFTAYPGIAHQFPPGEPGKGMKWILEQRRNAFPTKLVWEYNDHPEPRQADDDKVERLPKTWFYWLRCLRPVDAMQVTASRAGNEFDLDVTIAFPADFQVYLNPAMIDVTKDVVVRVKGKEVYRGKPVPDLVSVFESLDAKLDRTLLFDRRVQIPE